MYANIHKPNLPNIFILANLYKIALTNKQDEV